MCERNKSFCFYAASLLLRTGQLLQLESSKLKNKMPTGLKLLTPPGLKHCKLHEGSTVYLYQTLDWILLTQMTINQWRKFRWCNRCSCTRAQTQSGAHEGRNVCFPFISQHRLCVFLLAFSIIVTLFFVRWCVVIWLSLSLSLSLIIDCSSLKVIGWGGGV